MVVMRAFDEKRPLKWFPVQYKNLLLLLVNVVTVSVRWSEIGDFNEFCKLSIEIIFGLLDENHNPQLISFETNLKYDIIHSVRQNFKYVSK